MLLRASNACLFQSSTVVLGESPRALGDALARALIAFADLEIDLADWLGAEQALSYSSGYLANLGAVRALVGPQTLLVADAHNHASLIDGCTLS